MIRLALENGWTFSIAPDMRPAICAVAAWPTAETNDRVTPESLARWFTFSDGKQDRRCYDVEGLAESLAEVAAAQPPKGDLQ